MRERPNQMLEAGQQTRERTVPASDEELPFEVLRAIQDWKAGMIDPWADGFLEKQDTAAPNGQSHRRQAS